jgi:hypothetical protein
MRGLAECRDTYEYPTKNVMQNRRARHGQRDPVAVIISMHGCQEKKTLPEIIHLHST